MSDETNPAPRCPNCGNEGPSSGRSFCEVCGDFVDWDEVSRAERASRTPPRPEPQPPAPAPRPAPAPAEAAAPPPVPTTASFDDTPAESESKKSDLRRRARRLLVPLSGREDEVVPVLPGRPEPPRPEVRPVVANDESGIVCWNCGVGNRADRKFCRNCGVDLSAGPPPAAPRKRSFWQRIRLWFARLSRAQLIALAALLALAILAFPAFLLAQRLLNTETLLPPATVAASAADTVHPPTSAFDGNQNSWWGTGQSGDSAGQYLQANYNRSIDLRAVRITPGVSPRPQDRYNEYRPQRIDMTVRDAQGKNTVFHLNLKDDGVQQVSTPVNNVRQITLTLRSAYRSPGANKQVAVAEVEFLGTQGNG
jgi:hypothetical protein